MSKKTITIIDLVTEHNVYVIGEVPTGLQDRVKSIKFHNSLKPYNSGYQIEGPSYIIEFEESNIKRIIPMNEAKDIGIHVEEITSHKKTTIADVESVEATEQ